jgi:hypothetical protein
MNAILQNVAAVFAAVDHGDLCDTGHYYCPWVERTYDPPDEIIHFPSGGVVHYNGDFAGPRRLYEELSRIPADYRPDPVNPLDRYPTVREAEGLRRVCARGSVHQPYATQLVRVQFAVYPTREAALAAGYPDAEYGTWQKSPSACQCVEGWIALDRSWKA